MTPRTHPIRTAVLVGSAAGIAALGAGAVVHQAKADTIPPSFSITARADATRIDVLDLGAPAVPNGQVVSASPATAQSSLDSLGQSSGFAGLPYPGEFVATLPSSVNGLLAGNGPPIPPYPFYVTSSYPAAPTGSASQGTYSISTSSTPTSSVAEAVVGVATGTPQVASITAHAETTHLADGSIVADATDDTEGISVGSLLKIGSVTSHVHAIAVSGKALQTTQSLQLGTVTVAGLPFGVTSDGLVAGSSPLGIPAAAVESANALLQRAGTHLDVLPAKRTATSIQSAGLQVTYVTDVPSQGKVTVTVTLGLTSATIASATAGGASATTPASGLPPSQPPLVASAPASLPTAPTNGGPVPAASEQISPISSTSGTGIGSPRRVLPLGPSERSFYLVMVIAGAAAVACAQAYRYLAVRTRPLAP